MVMRNKCMYAKVLYKCDLFQYNANIIYYCYYTLNCSTVCDSNKFVPISLPIIIQKCSFKWRKCLTNIRKKSSE